MNLGYILFMCTIALLTCFTEGFDWVERLSVNPLKGILVESGLTYDYNSLSFTSAQLDALYSYLDNPNRRLVLELLNRTDVEYCSREFCCAHRDDILRVYLNEESISVKKLMIQLADLSAKKQQLHEVSQYSSLYSQYHTAPPLLQTVNFIMLPISVSIITSYFSRYPLHLTYIFTLTIVSSIFTYVKLYQLKVAERVATLQSLHHDPCSPNNFIDEFVNYFSRLFTSSRKSECLLYIEGIYVFDPTIQERMKYIQRITIERICGLSVTMSEVIPVFWEISPLAVFRTVWTELCFGWIGSLATHINEFLVNITYNLSFVNKLLLITILVSYMILARKLKTPIPQKMKLRPRNQANIQGK